MSKKLLSLLLAVAFSVSQLMPAYAQEFPYIHESHELLMAEDADGHYEQWIKGEKHVAEPVIETNPKPAAVNKSLKGEPVYYWGVSPDGEITKKIVVPESSKHALDAKTFEMFKKSLSEFYETFEWMSKYAENPYADGLGLNSPNLVSPFSDPKLYLSKFNPYQRKLFAEASDLLFAAEQNVAELRKFTYEDVNIFCKHDPFNPQESRIENMIEKLHKGMSFEEYFAQAAKDWGRKGRTDRAAAIMKYLRANKSFNAMTAAPQLEIEETVKRMKTLDAEGKVSEFIRSIYRREIAVRFFEETGAEYLPEMIVQAQKRMDLLAVNGKFTPALLSEAFAEAMVKKTFDIEPYLEKAVEKYPQAQQAAKKAEFKAELQKGNIPEEVAKVIYPKSTETAKTLNVWERIKLSFKGNAGKAKGEGLGIWMLGFIIGMELISGKVSANNTDFKTRLALVEIIGRESGPALAGTFCAQEPKIMKYIIKDYAGDKKEMEHWLLEHFSGQIDLLTSKDIMNEPVVKAAQEKWTRQQAAEKTAGLQKKLKYDGVQNARNAMFEGRSMLGPR